MVLTPSMRNDTAASTLKARARTHRHVSTMQIVGLVLVDLAIIIASVIIAQFLRHQVPVLGANAPEGFTDLLRPVTVAVTLLWPAMIAAFGGYSHKQLGFGITEYRRVLNASFAVAGMFGVAAYMLEYPMSRAFYLLLFAIGTPLLVVFRILYRRFIHSARRSGRLRASVLIAGDLSHIDDVARVLRREPWLGYDVVGALASDTDADETVTGIPVFGCPEDTVEILRITGANAVIFAEGSFRRGRDFNALARELEDHRAQTIVVPSLTDISAARMSIRPVAGIPLVHIEQPRAAAAGQWWKRVFDFLGSSLLLVLFSPILLAVALAVKADRGPVFFRQVRAGHKGEPFEMYKFRSMCVDAEARLKELEAHNNSDGVLFKMTDDPRITKVGKFIRRYSLDELPQLVNVWLGDMSLVGPRPALLKEVANYESDVHRRLDVRPGLTGLWQVSGRSDLSWEDTVRLDLYYVDNWSMVQDMAILLRTFGAVVGKSGAY